MGHVIMDSPLLGEQTGLSRASQLEVLGLGPSIFAPTQQSRCEASAVLGTE